jgi:hypothetical protein
MMIPSQARMAEVKERVNGKVQVTFEDECGS